MSIQPQHTQTLIKDLDFQAKYRLSHTQTDLMAYLINVPYWAIKVDGYFVIATSKIISDLPSMGKKTIEASFKVLKDLGLIRTKMVKVTKFKNRPTLRAIYITEKGNEYNAKLLLPSSEPEIRRLKALVKELEEKIQNAKDEKPKEKLESSKKEETLPTIEPKKEAINLFKEKVTKVFSRNQKFLCNAVEGWSKETIFYINSYNRLSILIHEKKQKQLKDPLQIHNFWEWLFNHSERIGNLIDFNKEPTLQELKVYYLHKNVIVNNKKFKIRDIVSNGNLVKLQIEDIRGNICLLLDGKNNKKFFSLKRCQEIILKFLE